MEDGTAAQHVPAPVRRPVGWSRRRAVIISTALLLAACSSDAATATTTTSTTVPPTAPPTVPPTLAPTSTLPPTTLPPTTSTSTTTTLPPTTTTIDPIVTEGGVVLVANAAAVPGAGAKLTKTLGDLGFVTRDPVNAAGADETLTISRVYYLPAARAVAFSISYLMGDIPILPMPTPPPIVGALDNLADANVLVMLGSDLAGKRLPDRP